MKKIIFIITLSFCFSTEIILKDGSKHSGEIVSQNSESVTLKTKHGQLTFSTSEIATISFESSKDEVKKEEIVEKVSADPYIAYIEAIGCKSGEKVGWDKDKYYCLDETSNWVAIDNSLTHLQSLGWQLGETCNREKGKLFRYKGGKWAEFWAEANSVDGSNVISNKSKTKGSQHFIGGINMSKMYGDDTDDDLEFNMGFNIGMQLFSDKIISGSTFSRLGWKLFEKEGSDSFNVIAKIDYITGYFLYPLAPNQGFSNNLLVGGQLGYLMSVETCYDLKVDGYSESDCEDIKSDFEDFDFGGLVGMLIPIPDNNNINVLATAYIGLLNIFEDSKSKNISFNLSLTYAMPK